jgi:hypothetical protein
VSVRLLSETELRQELEALFPKLRGTQWSPKSYFDTSYQCIAWAACRTTFTWWPPRGTLLDEYLLLGCFWPEAAPDDDRVGGFIETFALQGYFRCESFDYEFGFQKVALFASANNIVTHMARQELLGRGWLSKLGVLEDILHRDVRAVENGTYGLVVAVLKRTWWSALRHGMLEAWKCVARSLWYRTTRRGWPRIEDDPID